MDELDERVQDRNKKVGEIAGDSGLEVPEGFVAYPRKTQVKTFIYWPDRLVGWGCAVVSGSNTFFQVVGFSGMLRSMGYFNTLYVVIAVSNLVVTAAWCAGSVGIIRSEKWGFQFGFWSSVVYLFLEGYYLSQVLTYVRTGYASYAPIQIAVKLASIAAGIGFAVFCWRRLKGQMGPKLN